MIWILLSVLLVIHGAIAYGRVRVWYTECFFRGMDLITEEYTQLRLNVGNDKAFRRIRSIEAWRRVWSTCLVMLGAMLYMGLWAVFAGSNSPIKVLLWFGIVLPLAAFVWLSTAFNREKEYAVDARYDYAVAMNATPRLIR